MKGSDLQKGAVQAFTELSTPSPVLALRPLADPLFAHLTVKQKLASKPEIAKTLIPGFPVACRR